MYYTFVLFHSSEQSAMKISRVDTFVIEVPQKYPIAPYQNRYRPASCTGAWLVRLEADNGVVGWGEAPQRYLGGAPFTGQEATWLRSQLVGRDPMCIEALYADWNLGGEHLQSGIEMAMWDLKGKVHGQPLYELIGGCYRNKVELAACMGIRPPDQAKQIARLYVEMGFSTLKTKAGRAVEEDVAMARAVREAVGDQLQLRIDPNTGYSPEQTLELAKDLEPFDLQYLEQPMPADLLVDSAKLRGQTTTPLALNESVTNLEQVRRILDLQAAAVLLPDTYQCGGIWACKLITELAASAEVPCVMHCAHDFGLKTAAMLHLVASTPNFALANDCTYYGLEDDIIDRPFQIEKGQLSVPEAPGLGVEIDVDKVRKYAVDGTRAG